MAISQPGGAGTIIYVYDDTDATNHAAAPNPHTFAEIAAAFPADFVSNTTNEPSYRAKVNVQIGDTGVGTATTTIADTNAVVIWDSTFTLKWRITQTTSWNLNLGTKVGSGNQASGKAGCTLVFGALTSILGNVRLYGCTIKNRTGSLNMSDNTLGTTRDVINTLFQSEVTPGIATFGIGSSTKAVDNLYNFDISHAATTQPVVGSFFADAAERITICASTPIAFISAGSVGVTIKDLAVFGSPTTADFRWVGVTPADWKLVRPKFSGNAAKFAATSTEPILSRSTQEMWLYETKIVDGSTGNPIAGIPVKLTDAIGNVVVNQNSDANGEVIFGSGVTQNAVCVLDHYNNGAGVYLTRTRSPFLFEINTGAGRNINYQSRRYYSKWPGEETQTYSDMADIVSLVDAGGLPTPWDEMHM